jgi:hypothetical protein
MKNVIKILSVISLILVITLVSCGGGGGSGPVPAEPTSYIGVDNSTLNVYELVINKSGRAATGDTYVLSIFTNAGNLTGRSSGTITVNDSTFTLSKGGIITISGGAITAITGTINLDNGSTLTSPGTLVPVKLGGDGSLNGTWKKGSETVTISGSRLNYKGNGETSSGTIYYGGGILSVYTAERIVAGNFTVDSTKITFTGFTGYGSSYSGNWTK